MVTKAKRQQLEKVHALLGLPFSIGDTTAATEWTIFDTERETYCNYQPPMGGVVPDCKGMTIRDAMQLLRTLGYQARFSGQGKVVGQTPKARTAAKRGTTVRLELK